MIVVYQGPEPLFPATDQHPKANRFYVVDGKILSVAVWKRTQSASEIASLIAVHGTGDKKKVDEKLKLAVKNRAELKKQLANARSVNAPKYEYIVDATEKPTYAQVMKMLEPPEAV